MLPTSTATLIKKLSITPHLKTIPCFREGTQGFLLSSPKYTFLGSFWSLHHSYPGRALGTLDILPLQHAVHVSISAA